jgi:hypothetical protein
MGQFESLRKLSIAQPEKKKEIKKKNGNIIIPWLFHLIGIPVNFEVLNHAH